jgi:hypothetical protein
MGAQMLRKAVTAGCTFGFLFAASGAQAFTCTTWLNDEYKKEAQWWISGYITGVSTERGFNFGLMLPQEIWQWTDDYCQKNPKVTLDAAGQAFIKENGPGNKPRS